jgi:hypothetical protein
MKKFLLAVLLLLNACVNNPRLDITGMPHAPTDGPPAYQQGWNDGCQTGSTAYSSDYMRTRLGANFDGHNMEDPNYNRGWELGNSYCMYYMSTYLNNREFAQNDLRSDDTWFKMESDGFFSYKGIDKVNW